MRRGRFWLGVWWGVSVLVGGCRRDEMTVAMRRLEHGSLEQRIAAAQRLTALRAEQARESLLKALQSEDPRLRRVVAEGFAKWGDATLLRAAVEALSKDLTHPDAEVQRDVVQVLITVETPEATTALIAALKSPNPTVRELAAKNLVVREVSLSDEDTIRLNLILGNMEGVLSFGKKALPLLSALLEADPTLRSAAATAIGFIGEPSTVKRAVELMLADLKSPDASTRVQAVNALGVLGDSSAIAPLQNLAENDSDPNVRAGAKVAGYVLQKDVVSLIGAFSDSNPQLQGMAVRGVRNVPPKERAAAVEPLIRLLRTTTDTRLVQEVTGALGSCGVYATQPLLDALSKEPEWELRKRLTAALAQPRVRAGITKNMEVTLYNLYEKEVHDAVKADLGRLLKALES